MVSFLLYSACLLSTVYWLALSWSYFTCLPNPRTLPCDVDIPSQGCNQTTPQIYRLSRFINQCNGSTWGHMEFGNLFCFGLYICLNKRWKDDQNWNVMMYFNFIWIKSKQKRIFYWWLSLVNEYINDTHKQLFRKMPKNYQLALHQQSTTYKVFNRPGVAGAVL